VSDNPGIVYAIENLAWPGWIKIGRAEGPERDADGVLRRRVYQYNTGDPFRGYTVVAKAFAACCHDAERYAHAFLEVRCKRGDGEWFSCLPSVASAVLQQACSIARLAPQVRGERFASAIEEMRASALADTDTALHEHAGPPDQMRAKIAETAREAKEVILGLLDQQAMHDDKFEPVIQGVLKKLLVLEDPE
jgi:hypothetical protein